MVITRFVKSHLLQMRGLKLNGKKTYNRWITSHLLQMRGLKRKHGKDKPKF